MLQTLQINQLIHLSCNQKTLKFNTNEITEAKRQFIYWNAHVAKKEIVGKSEWPFYFRLKNTDTR